MITSSRRACRLVCCLLITGPLLLGTRSSAQTAQRGDDKVVELSPFQISAIQDRGYRASNSVSATRIDTPIEDLPLVIQAFTTEFITDIGATSILDVARYSPAVSSEAAAFTNGYNQTTIRGFVSTPFRNGIQSAAGAFADPYNVSRVEVVKGPSSLLYGQIAPGGLVNYLTKVPSGERSVRLTQTAGTDRFFRTELDADTGQIGPFAVRLSALAQTNERHVVLAKEKRLGVTPSFSWRISPDSVLSGSYEYYRIREDRPITVPINGPLPNGAIGSGPFVRLPRDFSYAALDDFRYTYLDTVWLNYTLNLAGWNLRAGGQWLDRSSTHFVTGQANGRLVPTPGIPNQIASPGIFQYRRVRAEINYTQSLVYQLDVARTWEWDAMKLKFVAGYQDEDLKTRQVQRQAPNAQTLPDWDLTNPATWNRVNQVRTIRDLALLNFDNGQKVSASGAYGLLMGTFLDDRLNVLGGVRRSEAEGTARNLITGVAGSSFAAKETSLQYGAIYKIVRGFSVFASSSDSFVPQSGNRIVNDVPVGPLPPVIGEGTDIGFKTTLLEGRISSTVSYFDLENSGAFQTVFTPDPVTGANRFTSVEAGVQRSRGWEADVNAAIADGWQIYAAVADFEAKIVRNLANPALVGAPLPATPKRTVSLWTKYSPLTGPAKGLSVGGGILHSSEKLARVDNLTLFLPDYTLVNAFVAYERRLANRQWRFALTVKNLTDKDYQESTFHRGEPRRFDFTVSVFL